MIEDRKLTEHFSLFEMTSTTHEPFQNQNRVVSDPQIEKLTKVADLLEKIRDILKVPLTVNSGYRCAQLNSAVGSTPVSQHLLCEAADFVPIGTTDLGDDFRTLWRAVKDGNLNVGQFIYETAARAYGVSSWLHVSLGEPYRPLARCNQILRMENGVYRFLDFPVKNV